MGCNNSHLRPLIRRCRRRSKKDDVNSTPKRQGQNPEVMVDSNHVGAGAGGGDPGGGGGGGDILGGIQFIGSAIRHPQYGKIEADQQSPCVPLQAQSEISHSQLDFFRMLDEKIQQGPDYDSEEDRADTELLIKRNIEVWKTTIQNSNAWTKARTNNRHSNPNPTRPHNNSNSKASKGAGSSRCQWDDEGD